MMPSAERVSIVIPAFNAERTIAATLRSACQQTYRDIEIIVVDDGSTDRTVDLVNQIGDPRIRLLRQENAGVAAARNLAVKQATGSLIAPLDSDDLWHPDKLSRQIKRLIDAGTDTGVVYCWSTDIDENDIIFEHRLDLDLYAGDVYAPLVLGNFIGNSSVPLIRKSLLEDIGGWDASLRARKAQGCEDWLLYLTLAERCKFALEPAFLVGYRRVAGAMSSDVPQMLRSSDIILDQVSERHPEIPRKFIRWSRAAFAHYAAQSYWVTGRKTAAAISAVKSVLLDPSVLARNSIKWLPRRALRYLYRKARSQLTGTPSEPPVKSYPIGIRFQDLVPEPDRVFSEGKVVADRRALVAGFRVKNPK